MAKYGIVTGGSGFLGKYIVNCLDKLGLKTINIDLIEHDFKNDNIVFLKGDITNYEDMNLKINQLLKPDDSVEVLINNAAIDNKFAKSIMNISEADFDLNALNYEFEVSIKGPLILLEILNPFLINAKSASVIFIGSDLSVIAPNQKIYVDEQGVQTFNKKISYSVLKHAILGMVKYLAIQYAKDQIRVNSVSPAPILNNQPEFLVNNIKQSIPMNRLAQASDITGVIEFLSSEKSAFITGQNVVVDGGRTIW